MTAATSTAVPLTRSEQKVRTRQRILGIIYLLVATAMVIAFALSVEPADSSTFTLTPANARITVPNLVLPSALAIYVLAAAVAFAGAVQLTRGFGARWALIMGLVAFAFVFAFLTWVAAGQSMNLTGVLQTTVQRAVPIVFGALSGVLCERAGVVNIAIEGQLLSGAFISAVVASVTDNPWLGIASAVLDRRAARAVPGGARHPLSGRPGHRRLLHQHPRHRTDGLPLGPHPPDELGRAEQRPNVSGRS